MSGLYPVRPPRPHQRVLGPDDSRAPIRRRRHGLTPDEQDAMLAAQDGACAVCRKAGRTLYIDHDHRHCPGREGCRRCVRGLLCNRCNSALGLLGEDNLERLVAYLGMPTP